eukprot:CAMPEP_0116145480 /NCGR_PEP_ID=MMETSP0329-20121206/16616_1 /TAXON_ID=697910 /ORGANISM="Pseudo-nitzschia arenysensis, Strain B593" /LENGTH=503 /DNA_ID=CAMNT_0003641089 /DNA_START=98 /DNA_END=1605 /DNA_ORIENTATION=-
MVIANDPPQVPPDGYVDNPTEVSGYLSRFPVDLNIQDLPKIADKGGFVDDILSNELLQLSLQDRNAINEEIHGVQTFAREETPELLSKALEKMQTEIDMIPNKNAYDRSQQVPNTYVNSSEFRLRFLRCELFDERSAASKMVKFLDLLSELFGDFALRRQVQMSDFSREEMQAFRVGHQQLLPYRDRSGRRIFALVGGLGVTVPLVTRVKILVYTILVASDDVETQQKGITTIIWPGTKTPKDDQVGNLKFDRILFLKRVFEFLPVRTCSMHFSFPSTPFFQVIRTLFMLSMPSLIKRMKFHVGENIERQYSIKSYGVPVELIPLTDTGNIKTTYLKQWMKLRRIVEVMKMTESGEDNSVSIIECPGSNDVVFRSGTSMSCHPGNVRFRCLVESKHEIPSIVSQTTQAELAEQLIEEIEARGGRFLKWDNRGYWTELTDRLQIHTKVALSIRDFKYKTKAQRNRQTNQSYTYLFQCQDGNKRRRTNDGSPDTATGIAAPCRRS